jgi:hypothetical protein
LQQIGTAIGVSRQRVHLILAAGLRDARSERVASPP